MPSPKPGRPGAEDAPEAKARPAKASGTKAAATATRGAKAGAPKAAGRKADPDAPRPPATAPRKAAKTPSKRSAAPPTAGKPTGTGRTTASSTKATAAKAGTTTKARKAAPKAAAPPAKTTKSRGPRPGGRGPAPTAEPEAPVILDLTGDEPVIDLRETPSPARPVSGRPLDLDHGLSLRNLTVDDGEVYARAERFVYDIYRAAGYCRESSRHRVEELQPWREDSQIWTVLDEEGTVLGTVRIIFGPWADLPVGQFRRIDDRDADPVAELSSLAVAPTSRGLSVVVHLCRAAFVHSWRRGASALVCIIDDWMVDLLCDVYALPMRPVGVQRYHMGGDVTPSGMSFLGSEFEDTARRNPGYWQWMTEAFTPEEVGRWQLPIVLDDPDAHPWAKKKPAKAAR